jgi:hypothetical protein
MNQPCSLPQSGIRRRERILNLATLRRAGPPAAFPVTTPPCEPPMYEVPAAIIQDEPLPKKRA